MTLGVSTEPGAMVSVQWGKNEQNKAYFHNYGTFIAK